MYIQSDENYDSSRFDIIGYTNNFVSLKPFVEVKYLFRNRSKTRNLLARHYPRLDLKVKILIGPVHILFFFPRLYVSLYLRIIYCCDIRLAFMESCSR